MLELEAHLLLRGQQDPVQRRHLVERARQRALQAGAVVAPDPDHEGVVELTHLLDRVEDSPHVPVRVLRVAGVGLHLPGVELPLGLGQRVHVGEAVVARRQLGVEAERRRAPSGARSSSRGGRPSPRRSAPCTCRPTPWGRGGARGCSRSRIRRTTASRLLRAHDGATRSSSPTGRRGSNRAFVLPLGHADRLLVLGDQRVVLPGLTSQEAPEVVEPESGGASD